MQPKQRKQATLALSAGACLGAVLLASRFLPSRQPETPDAPEAGGRPAATRSAAEAPTSAGTASVPVDRPAPTLSLLQAVGQRIIYSYEGTSPPQRLREMIGRGEAGGIILFKRNVGGEDRLRETMHALQSIQRPPGLEAPLLIMIDQEGGRVKRLPGPPMLSPQAIGLTRSPEVARREGAEAGRYLLSCGVNVNLAPVVDVARPGTYQERSLRAYGRDAALVSSMASAFAQGLRREGVAACYKHFPGLGAAPTNEDLEVNRLNIPRAMLDKVDLRPFADATEECLVMTSTGVYPALDAEPALFSRRVVTGELRQKLGFKGITITDDLEVPALQSYGSTTTRGRRAIEAGNDLLLYCVSLDQGRAALRGLAELYEQKKLDTNELYSTTARVLAWRTRLGQTAQAGKGGGAVGAPLRP